MLIVYLNSCDCPKEKNEYLPILDEKWFLTLVSSVCKWYSSSLSVLIYAVFICLAFSFCEPYSWEALNYSLTPSSPAAGMDRSQPTLPPCPLAKTTGRKSELEKQAMLPSSCARHWGRTNLKMSGFGVKKVLLIRKVPTKKIGYLVVPQICLKKVQGSVFSYVKGRDEGEGKEMIDHPRHLGPTRVPVRLCLVCWPSLMWIPTRGFCKSLINNAHFPYHFRRGTFW